MAKRSDLPNPKLMKNHELFKEFVKHLQFNTGHCHHFGAEILDRMEYGVKAKAKDRLKDRRDG